MIFLLTTEPNAGIIADIEQKPLEVFTGEVLALNWICAFVKKGLLESINEFVLSGNPFLF